MTNINIKSYLPANIDLGGRSLALAIRKAAVEAGRRDGWPVTLDFTGIDFITPGAADELVGVLVYRHGRAEFDNHVRLANADPMTREMLDRVIENRLRLREKRLSAKTS